MLTRDSTDLTDPGWSHHWRTGGPITLAELASSGPMPLAGDTQRSPAASNPAFAVHALSYTSPGSSWRAVPPTVVAWSLDTLDEPPRHGWDGRCRPEDPGTNRGFQ
jgi:hypothetical protein